MARVASESGVNGWVRNLPDGSVEAFLEGEEVGVRKVVEWARRGPPRARVDRLDVESAQPKNHRTFMITG
jgi:acylphosphatase